MHSSSSTSTQVSPFNSSSLHGQLSVVGEGGRGAETRAARPREELHPPSPTSPSVFTWAGQRTPASSNEDPWPHFHFWSRIRDSGACTKPCLCPLGRRDR